MPMSDDGVPVYVRRINDHMLTTKRPQHIYEVDLRLTPGGCPVHSTTDPPRKVVCQLTTNVRETTIWCPDDCKQEAAWVQMHKAWAEMGTSFATVWQDTDIPNLSTGRVETDPKKFRQHLAQKSEEMAERLGMAVDYQPVDMTDKDALGVTDEGMDATHDAAVREGRKDSRGRFVW